MVIADNQYWIISNVNLIFHEAGHVVFSFFGSFMHALGGTVLELTIPTICYLYFRYREHIPGQVFSLWWLTTSLYGISIYMADARARVLPLLGGQEGHDWAYLLGRLGLLKQDLLLSRLFIVVALCIVVYMVILVHRYWELEKGRMVS